MTLDLDAIKKRLADEYDDGNKPGGISQSAIEDVEDLVAEVERLRAALAVPSCGCASFVCHLCKCYPVMNPHLCDGKMTCADCFHRHFPARKP